MLHDVPYVTVPFHRACPRPFVRWPGRRGARALSQCGRLGRASARASRAGAPHARCCYWCCRLDWLGRRRLLVGARGGGGEGEEKAESGGEGGCAREGRAGWLRQSLKRVSEFFKDGRNGGGERDPCVLRLPGTLRCEPLHDRVRHMQGLVPRQVKGAGWQPRVLLFSGGGGGEETTKMKTHRHCPFHFLVRGETFGGR